MPTPIAIAGLPGNLVGRFEGREHGSSVSFFVGSFPEGTGPKLHVHPYDETFIVEEGGATFTVADETLDVGAGNIVVVPAQTPHKFLSSAPDGMRMVSITPWGEMVQEWLDD
jgi:mannose-6-phosphate isomerase-like protein (cupin superfamily)